jgi:hypothetical protein
MHYMMGSVFSWTQICYMLLSSVTFCRSHCTTKSYCTSSTAAALRITAQQASENLWANLYERWISSVLPKIFPTNLQSPLHPKIWVQHWCIISSNLFPYNIHILPQIKTRFILLSVGKLYWNSYGQKWRRSVLPEMHKINQSDFWNVYYETI